MTTNLMVFIAGDNDLDTFGITDIEEMMSVSDTGDELTILVQQDQSKDARDSGTKRYVIRNGKKEQIIHMGETNTGDASTLTEFLRWGMEDFPAERNIAVLWNHGGGTRDEFYPAYENAVTTVRSMNTNPTLGNQGSFFSQSSRMEHVRRLMNAYQIEKGEPTRSIGDAESKSILFDDESKDFLDNLELKKVFDDLGMKLDIIGFDACLMSMLEVVYQLREHTELVVGSEELEPGEGWDYSAIVSYLVANPNATNEEVSEAIIESFIDSYADRAELKVTLSAMRTNKLRALGGLLNGFAHTILRHEKKIRRTFLAIVDDTQTFDYANNERIYRDLKHFVLLTQEHYEDNEEIVESATKLLAGLDELMVENKTNNFEHAHGVSVYLPLLPNMSDFAIAIFSALDINSEEHAPYWLKLFKQIGNLDTEANQFLGETVLEEYIEEIEYEEENFPFVDSSLAYIDLVEVPAIINVGLSNSRNIDVSRQLGHPKCVGTSTTGAVEQRFKRRFKPLNFKTNVNGFDLAVDSFAEVMVEIENVYPELAYLLDTAGMAVCRCVQPSCESASNHSWGIAIDLKIAGVVDARGDDQVLYGLTLIAPIFNKHGWFWGAGFTIEDAMHFEVSSEKMREWEEAGLLLNKDLGISNANTLQMGDRSSAVVELQTSLNKLGFNLIEDGIYGSGTHYAVIAFQQEYGLAVDGIVGEETLSAINNASTTRGIKMVKAEKFTLHIGMRNRSVQVAQEYLNRYGFRLMEHGSFDKPMRQAVLDYQKAYGLEENGLFSEEVWNKLENPTRSKPTIIRTHPISALGDSNEEVYQLQSMLSTKGFDLVVSKDFGIEMQNIVQTIQEENRLEVTGVVDEATRKLIAE